MVEIPIKKPCRFSLNGRAFLYVDTYFTSVL